MILDDIIADKAREVMRLRSDFSYEEAFSELKDRVKELLPPKDFLGALKKTSPGDIRVIAEVKKASPSKGVIRADFDPVDIAKSYERAGAAAISVLTDEKYFHGSLLYLTAVKNNVTLPVLRKDFIIDPYQVYEARAAGADAILLIAAVLGEKRLVEFLALSNELGMSALVEVHAEEELKAALCSGAGIIGINNRDLKTFKTDIETTRRLAPLIPPGKIIVSESGINTKEDILTLENSGVSAFLIGEALVREQDPGKKLMELRGVGKG